MAFQNFKTALIFLHKLHFYVLAMCNDIILLIHRNYFSCVQAEKKEERRTGTNKPHLYVIIKSNITKMIYCMQTRKI